MDSSKSIEITQTVFELLLQEGEFSVTELVSDIEGKVSKSDVIAVLDHLQDSGWVKESDEGSSLWELGPTGRQLLDIDNSDTKPVRVLPDEIPREELPR